MIRVILWSIFIVILNFFFVSIRFFFFLVITQSIFRSIILRWIIIPLNIFLAERIENCGLISKHLPFFITKYLMVPAIGLITNLLNHSTFRSFLYQCSTFFKFFKYHRHWSIFFDIYSLTKLFLEYLVNKRYFTIFLF